MSLFSPLNSSSLILLWSVPLESGHCIVNYSVKVNNTWQQLVTTNTSVVITGLSVGSIYEIVVTGRDSEEDEKLTVTYYLLHKMIGFNIFFEV